MKLFEVVPGVAVDALKGIARAEWIIEAKFY